MQVFAFDNHEVGNSNVVPFTTAGKRRTSSNPLPFRTSTDDGGTRTTVHRAPSVELARTALDEHLRVIGSINWNSDGHTVDVNGVSKPLDEVMQWRGSSSGLYNIWQWGPRTKKYEIKLKIEEGCFIARDLATKNVVAVYTRRKMKMSSTVHPKLTFTTAFSEEDMTFLVIALLYRDIGMKLEKIQKPSRSEVAVAAGANGGSLGVQEGVSSGATFGQVAGEVAGKVAGNVAANAAVAAVESSCSLQ